MAKWWAITGPAKTELRGGVGEAAFTVTNVTATAVRGLVRILPEGNAKPEMFKVVGESTLDWSPNETKQVTVQINAHGAPPGSYVFTFAVVSEGDPSELSDRLSSAFDVGAGSTGKKFPIGILIGIIVGVLLIGGVLAWLLTRGGDDDEPKAASSPTATEEPTPPPTPTPTPIPEIPRGGCESYNPNNVAKVNIGSLFVDFWRVTDFATFTYEFDDQEFRADNAVALTKSFTEHCFIDHVEYWLDRSNLPFDPPIVNCIPYDTAEVERIGKIVTDGDDLNVQLPTLDDAEKVFALAVNFSQRCTMPTGFGDPEIEYWL